MHKVLWYKFLLPYILCKIAVKVFRSLLIVSVPHRIQRATMTVCLFPGAELQRFIHALGKLITLKANPVSPATYGLFFHPKHRVTSLPALSLAETWLLSSSAVHPTHKHRLPLQSLTVHPPLSQWQYPFSSNCLYTTLTSSFKCGRQGKTSPL